jgi:hypothetical protein
VNLKVEVSLIHFTLFYTSRSFLEGAIVYSKMFWLDGSSTFPFPPISIGFVNRACVESLAEDLASIEN